MMRTYLIFFVLLFSCRFPDKLPCDSGLEHCVTTFSLSEEKVIPIVLQQYAYKNQIISAILQQKQTDGTYKSVAFPTINYPEIGSPELLLEFQYLGSLASRAGITPGPAQLMILKVFFNGFDFDNLPSANILEITITP